MKIDTRSWQLAHRAIAACEIPDRVFYYDQRFWNVEQVGGTGIGDISSWRIELSPINVRRRNKSIDDCTPEEWSAEFRALVERKGITR